LQITEEIHIDRLEGAVIGEIPIEQLELAISRENPSNIHLEFRRDLKEGWLCQMFDDL